jgi:hypothetical protein
MKVLSFDIGIKNLSYCILDENYKIYDWNIVDLCGNLNIKKDKYTIFENIPKKLDEYNLCDVDVVLLENQPCLKNPTMKTIQIIIYTYFLINGLNNQSSTISKILFISAKNKLSFYDGPCIECKLKSKYSQTKFLGKEYTKYYLKDNQEKLDYFNSHKKKDDLSDAFLQGMSYFECDKKPKKQNKKQPKNNNNETIIQENNNEINIQEENNEINIQEENIIINDNNI